MSAAPRLRAGTILVLAAFAVLPFAGLVQSCGTDAVGVDACRSIESARCDALVSCPKEQHGYTEDQAAACKLVYRDDCLHGIENNEAGADLVLTDKDACVKAIAATAACAKAGAKTMAGCAGAALVPTANAAVSPCDMLAGSVVGNSARVGGVELLEACNFVAAIDGGAGSSASSSSGSSSSTTGSGASSSSSTASASASSSTASASSSAAGGGGGSGDASPE